MTGLFSLASPNFILVGAPFAKICFLSWGHFVCSSLEAVNRIYEIKGRKYTSPLAICVGDVSDICRFAVTDHLPHGLLDSLLPGPVTVILTRGLLLYVNFYSMRVA